MRLGHTGWLLFFGFSVFLLLVLVAIFWRKSRRRKDRRAISEELILLRNEVRCKVGDAIVGTGISLETNYATVRIFYATDRNSTGLIEPAEFYGSERAHDEKLSLGVCEVSIPRDHKMGRLEKPSIWKLQFREDPEKHVVLLSVEPRPENEFYQELSTWVQLSENKEAFVFIHGFNVSFEDGARRTAQLAYDLGFDGAPILYSWPSEGKLLRYMVDETNVEWTVSHLRIFLADIASRANAHTVHLVAHSMGNRALTRVLDSLAMAPISAVSAARELWAVTRALDSLAMGPSPGPRPLFRQVALMAPDIDAEVFKQLAKRIARTAERMTLYASSNDKALKASKEVHGYPRAGESGESIVVVPDVDTIDVSAVDTSLLGHSYYAERRSVLSDLFSLIREGKPPSERFGLAPVQLAHGVYYVFKP